MFLITENLSAFTLEDVLTGKAEIGRSSADLLGKLFHVDPLLFVR